MILFLLKCITNSLLNSILLICCSHKYRLASFLVFCIVDYKSTYKNNTKSMSSEFMVT